MKVAIDVDGVIADQIPGVLKRIEEQYGIRMAREQIRTWDQPVPGTTTDIRIEIETALSTDPAYVLGMPVIEGSVESIAQLRQDGHTIVLATHRDPAMEKYTRQWLAERGFGYEELISTRAIGKGNLEAEILVDDNPDNVINFATKQRSGVLFTQPWNESFQKPESHRLFRARDWSAVLEIIRELFPTHD